MEDRFWSKVRRGSPDECWEWLASKDKHGYGQFKVPTTMARAHRVAWELTHGKIPEGLVVRHKCRGKCCNPNHMELGTYHDNHMDMIRDGTITWGEKNKMSILTEQQVQEIKSRLQSYHRGLGRQLANEFNVSPMTISDIRTGRKWGHLLS